MPTADVDVAALLDALERNAVEYVVIGGFAAELHDVAIPPTRDVDITPAPSEVNLERLVAALGELAARLRVVDGPPGGIEVPGGITPKWFESLVMMSLVTSAGPLDISMVPDGTLGYVELVEGQVVREYQGRRVPVAGLADVIRSKEAAGRAKDLLVLPALRAHQRSSSDA
ncbi:MAG TPA: hypothetical protein VGC47_14200 [Acidimicrobiia bacterium]